MLSDEKEKDKLKRKTFTWHIFTNFNHIANNFKCLPAVVRSAPWNK